MAIHERARGATARWGALGLLGAALATGVAGCEDASVITHTSRETSLSRTTVQALALGGLPTEIHGRPWRGTNPREIAAQLRLPNAFPPDARFRLVEPVSNPSDRNRRLVLVFNESRTLDAWDVCDAARTLRGFESQFSGDKGVSVFAVFCDGEAPIGRGQLRAPGVVHGDWPSFQNEMRRLIRAIVTDPSADTR
ncbi:MAG: hypothetical protein AAFW46_05200 [Pseudomonadota bacterium]